MKFMSCKNEVAILSEEPTDKRALLNACRSLPSESTSTSDHRKPARLRLFSFNELETATGGFGKASLVGKGSHGILYKGTLKDGRVVAVKRQENLLDEPAFNNELEILSTLHSHRLVNLLGFCQGLNSQEKLLVIDFMANGTLHDNLHHQGMDPLNWSMRVQVALQIAKALLALHSANPPVIHRDVKSSSVVFDGKWNAKLGDFGLAHRGIPEDSSQQQQQQQQTGKPIEDCNPECDPTTSTTSGISTKDDVFSFGILILEILSGRKAIDSRFKPPNITDWALPLIKQEKAHGIYDRRLIFVPEYARALRLMARIASRCLRRNSMRRPSMSNVIAGLDEVAKKIPSQKWVGLASVIKLTSACQNPDLDVRSTPVFMSHMRTARTANLGKLRLADKPIPSRRASMGGRVPENSPDYQRDMSSRFVSRASSLDSHTGSHLRIERTRVNDKSQLPEVQDVDEQHSSRGDDGSELPRGMTEVTLAGRRRIYNQWRNPMFDIATRSPDIALACSVSDKRGAIFAPQHEVGSGVIFPIPTPPATEEGSTGMSNQEISTTPSQVLSAS